MFTKRTLWLSIIVSMIIGGAVGFEIDRYASQNSDSRYGKTRFLNYVTKELGLTTYQRGQLDSIIVRAHPKFQAIRKRFNADMQAEMDSTQDIINSILTPDQQSKLRVLFSKIESNRNQQDSK